MPELPGLGGVRGLAGPTGEGPEQECESDAGGEVGGFGDGGLAGDFEAPVVEGDGAAGAQVGDEEAPFAGGGEAVEVGEQVGAEVGEEGFVGGGVTSVGGPGSGEWGEVGGVDGGIVTETGRAAEGDGELLAVGVDIAVGGLVVESDGEAIVAIAEAGVDGIAGSSAHAVDQNGETGVVGEGDVEVAVKGAAGDRVAERDPEVEIGDGSDFGVDGAGVLDADGGTVGWRERDGERREAVGFDFFEECLGIGLENGIDPSSRVMGEVEEGVGVGGVHRRERR